MKRKQNLAFNGQSGQVHRLRGPRHAHGLAFPVLKAVFQVKDQGNSHPVFIEKSCVRFFFRMPLNGTVRRGGNIGGIQIRVIIFTLERAFLIHLAHHDNAHARSSLSPQLAEIGFLVKLDPAPLSRRDQRCQKFFNITLFSICAKANASQKFMHMLTFLIF